MEPTTLDPSKAWVSKALSHRRQLLCCRVSPCGKYAVAGGADAKVHRWDLESDGHTALDGHTGWVFSVAFQPDGKRFFSADLHGTVQAWSPDGAQPLWTVKEAHSEWIKALAVSPDGKLVATGGYDRAVRLWSSETGKLFREMPAHPSYACSIAFHPNGLDLVTGDYVGTLRHFDLETGKRVREFEAKPLYTRKEDFESHTGLCDVGGVRGLTFDPRGETLACCGISEVKGAGFSPGIPCAILFDWFGGRQTAVLKIKNGKCTGWMNEVRFLEDGTLVGAAEGFSHGALGFWKGVEPNPFHTMDSSSIYGFDLHPNGRQLVAAALEPRGQGGNGRSAKTREEYVGNGGQVKIYSLFAKPPAAKAVPPKRK